MSVAPVQMRDQQSRPDGPMAQNSQGGIQHETHKRISDVNVLNIALVVKRVIARATVFPPSSPISGNK
jgi:hypothetical protein